MEQNYDALQFLSSVWNQASRQVDIRESTAGIIQILSNRLPIAQIMVRRINQSLSCLETVAAASTGRHKPLALTRTECSAEEVRHLLSWCAENNAFHRGRGRMPAGLRQMIPNHVHGEALVGPLLRNKEPTGLLIVVAQASADFSAEDEHIVKLLLDPFAAALEIDRRLHETKLLREAGEADRQALLVKLGRKDVATPIIGLEAGLRSVMERVKLVAGSDVPMLLFGETGSGKEVIARAIHTQSPRASGPFIRVNCGAIPPDLIDSQLFGHEKGSFTGATDTRHGWFERADGGTLFLDEIGDLPLAAQVRLLRVLQDGVLERVGSQRSFHVDVRIVGATHRDLAKMVQTGTFREDLWYRLAVFPISIPPLRDRAADIGVLASHFAEKAATRFGLSATMPTAEDIRLLMAYPWPGNVRELAAVIDRAALLGNGAKLEIAVALGATSPMRVPDNRHFTRDGATSESGFARTKDLEAASRADDSLELVMRKHIEAALAATHGRVEGPFGAARRLKINSNTLRSRMRKLKIDWRHFRI